MSARRAGTLVLSLVMACASTLAPGPAAAQIDSEPPASASLTCWRGAPRPACGGFFLVEAQGVFPLLSSSRLFTGPGGGPVEYPVFESKLEWSLGYMVNVTPMWAAGGAISVGTGAYDALTGLRLRLRRWIRPQLSVEMQGGLVRTHASNLANRDLDGISAEVRVNLDDQGSFFLRWDGLPVPEHTRWDGDLQPRSFEQALHVGVATGSTWTVVGSGLLGLGWIVALALVNTS